MIKYSFIPNFQVIANFQPTYSIKEFEKEIGVYSATPKFINENCGNIAKTILKQIPNSYYEEADKLKLYVNCDVRIHRLYPSDYPAYPGWHADGEFRETYFSQPDLNRIQVHKHLIATVSSHNSGISNTQFLNETFNFESEENPDFNLWQQVNEVLDSKQNKSIWDSKDGQLCQFDSWTLHRTMPAKIRGWRLFFRMSMWHKPNLGNGGMITKQEQVYKYIGNAGW